MLAVSVDRPPCAATRSVAVVASSIQFVSGFSDGEAWANLPLEKPRLLDLLHDTRAARSHPTATALSKKTYHDVNVGHLHIDWATRDPQISGRIVDVDGHTQLAHILRLSELRPAPR